VIFSRARARLSVSSHLPSSKIDSENEHWEQTREAPVLKKSSPALGITNAN
jgi:hypothetical protein